MNRSRVSQQGFSLVELLVVIAIMLVVVAAATPSFITFLTGYKLRAVLQQTGGVLQQMRMEAVRKNSTIQIKTTTSSSRTVAYADLNNDGTWNSAEPSIVFPSNITVTSTGHPGDATTSQNYTATSAMPRFNARGLPCVPVPSPSGVCQNFDGTNMVGFVVYVKNQSSMGGARWGAITITPAGRIRTWLWNGAAYSGL